MYKTTVISLVFVCLCSTYCSSQNSVVIVKSNLFQYEFTSCHRVDNIENFKPIYTVPFEVYEQKIIDNNNFLFITNRSEYYQITKNPKDINFNEYNLIIGTVTVNPQTTIHLLSNGTENIVIIWTTHRIGISTKWQQISFLVPKKYCNSPHQICFNRMHM